MAAKIAQYNYEWRFDTIVLFNLLSSFHLKTFLTEYNKSVIIRKNKYLPPPCYRNSQVPQFVIYGDDIGELTDFLQFLVDNKYDCSAKYILVCTSPDLEDCDENQLFETLARLFISNVIYLKLRDGNDPAAYTYYPFLPDKCWHHEPVSLTVQFGCPYDQCYKSQFPEKFYNLYKCKFIVSTMEQAPFMIFTNKSDGTREISGSDGNILRLVVSMLNATLVILTPAEGNDWGRFENKTWTGSLGHVFNNKAHASMCSSPLTSSKYSDFRISFCYDSLDLVWIAAISKLRPSWEKLLRPLDVYIRIALFFMFIGIVVLNTFIRSKIWNMLRKVFEVAPLKSNLLFYSWTLFLGMPVTRVPTRVAFRTLFCTWIWFCVIFRSVYQGVLIGSLKVRVTEDNLKNFQDVLKNDYPFGGLPSLREYYTDDPKVYDHWKPLMYDKAREQLHRITDGSSDFVLALSREYAIEYLLQYNGRKQAQIIPEKIANIPIVMFFKKNSNFAYSVSRLLTVIMEGGFSQQLYKRYVKHARILTHQEQSRIPVPLRLQHFTGSFAVLFFGWIMASIFFLVEYVCGRDIMKNNIEST
ncbi:uncharacterized protein LOC113231861 [Hyposmocoma kahamanoa]|uniref:uncharacterized protein LOC113231861 n=1 Tax=Hyposmocoma kahamanoa TaxID=1477025 RepID=UPI000E6D8B70|nr:uncharacterized protein LOC113231861 [Hyposmocoma kahamanoa]